MKNQCQVFVLDGDALLSNILKTRLEANGLPTVICQSAATALVLIESLHPRLIIMELSLPDGSGLDLLPRIRLGEAGMRAQIIVLTMYDNSSTIQAAIQLGANLALRKSEMNANKIVMAAASACSMG